MTRKVRSRVRMVVMRRMKRRMNDVQEGGAVVITKSWRDSSTEL